MNLIVSAAIVLLNPYVTVYISYKIPPFALSVHIPDVSASTCVEADPKVLLGLPFCDKAFGRLHHSGNSLGFASCALQVANREQITDILAAAS